MFKVINALTSIYKGRDERSYCLIKYDTMFLNTVSKGAKIHLKGHKGI